MFDFIEFSDVKISLVKLNFHFEDIWKIHWNLSRAAKKLNNIYQFQLLLWVFTLSLNGLSRINTLVIYYEYETFIVVRDFMCAIGCMINLFLIIITCHLTSRTVSILIENNKYIFVYLFFINKTFFIILFYEGKSSCKRCFFANFTNYIY